MTRFNRQQMKSATRDEIQLDAADLVAARRLAVSRTPWAARARSVWRTDVLSENLRISNYENGAGYIRDPKAELFLPAAANLVAQHTFYERAGARDRRYAELVRQHALSDPAWTPGLLRWLRTEAHMPNASLAGAAEFVHARQEAGRVGADNFIRAGQAIFSYSCRMPVPCQNQHIWALTGWFAELVRRLGDTRGWWWRAPADGGCVPRSG